MSQLFEIKNSIGEDKLQKIHDYSLKVLQQAGMKFLSEEILTSLEKSGAKINWSKNIAYIPPRLVEDMLTSLRQEIESGKKQIMLNGGVSFRAGDKIDCKFGSIAPNIFDWEKKKEKRSYMHRSS